MDLSLPPYSNVHRWDRTVLIKHASVLVKIQLINTLYWFKNSAENPFFPTLCIRTAGCREFKGFIYLWLRYWESQSHKTAWRWAVAPSFTLKSPGMWADGGLLNRTACRSIFCQPLVTQGRPRGTEGWGSLDSSHLMESLDSPEASHSELYHSELCQYLLNDVILWRPLNHRIIVLHYCCCSWYKNYLYNMESEDKS